MHGPKEIYMHFLKKIMACGFEVPFENKKQILWE